MVTSDSFLALLGIVTLFISIISLARVYKLFKWTELALSFSTIYISLSVICFIARNPINIALRVLIYQNNDHKDDTNDNLALIMHNFMTMHYTFMFGTFFFDLYKWQIFIISSNYIGNLDEIQKIEEESKI